MGLDEGGRYPITSPSDFFTVRGRRIGAVHLALWARVIAFEALMTAGFVREVRP